MNKKLSFSSSNVPSNNDLLSFIFLGRVYLGHLFFFNEMFLLEIDDFFILYL